MLNYILLPKDWDEINVWEEQDPNKIGEALRHYSFVGRNGQRGCYSTFELADFFDGVDKGKDYERALKVVCPEFIESFKYFIYDQPEIKEQYISVEPFKLIVAWEWQGDGTLYFRLIGRNKDIEVINTDCKKDYDWEFVK